MGRTVTITCLFTDLVDSTARASAIGEDAADALRARHFGGLREVVQSHGGVEVKNVGDGLMVVFTSVSDALSCGLALQRTARRQQLEMRVGISSGEASTEDGDYFGTPVIEAARLCAAAPPGRVLVADIVRLLAGGRGSHRFEPVGALDLKGLPEPIAAYEVHASEDTGRTLPPVLGRHRSTLFVGREAELAAVERALARSAKGERVVLAISGEPGVGKTRLVGEAARRAHTGGALVLAGRCTEESVIPYEPLTEALRDAAPTLRRYGGRLLAHLAHLVPAFGEPAAPSDPEADRWLLFEAVAELLEAACADQPVVLVLEDAHWADRSSIALVQHILRRPEDQRLALVFTYREAELVRTHPLTAALASLRRDRLVERITLRGFGPDETGALMAQLLDDDADDLVAAVHAETDGNPFFIEEVVAARRSGDAETIPESVQEAIGRRLSRLSTAANDALAVAAVVGREFTLAELAAGEEMAPVELAEPLDEAVRAGFVLELADVGRYAFAHALVREVLLLELSQTRRSVLHRRIGRHLATTGAAATRVAYHALAAAALDTIDDVVHWATLAGDELAGGAAFDEAAALCERAVGIVDLLAPERADVRGALRHDVIHYRRAATRGDEAAELADEAMALAESTADPLLIARATLDWVDMRLQFTPEIASERERRMVALLDVLPADAHELRAQTLAYLADFDRLAGRTDLAKARCREAIAEARQAGDCWPLAFALTLQHSALQCDPLADADLASLREAGDVLRRLPPSRAGAFAMAGFNLFIDHPDLNHALKQGDGAAGDELLALTEAAVERWPTPMNRSTLASRRGADALRRLPMDHAEEAVEAGRVAGEAWGSDLWVLNYGVQLVSLRREQDRSDEALAVVDTQLALTPGNRAWHCGKAWFQAWSGDLAGARATYERLAAEAFAGIPRDNTFALSIGLVAEVCWLLDDRPSCDSVAGLVEPWRGLALGIASSDSLGSADRLLALLAVTAGDHDRAEELFAAAIAGNERLGSPRWIAWTKAQWADALDRADADPDRAARLRAEAGEIADAYGLALLRRCLDTGRFPPGGQGVRG